jgi:hypothetical protein
VGIADPPDEAGDGQESLASRDAAMPSAIAFLVVQIKD